jgi:hypothetical protein
LSRSGSAATREAGIRSANRGAVLGFTSEVEQATVS